MYEFLLVFRFILHRQPARTQTSLHRGTFLPESSLLAYSSMTRPKLTYCNIISLHGRRGWHKLTDKKWYGVSLLQWKRARSTLKSKAFVCDNWKDKTIRSFVLHKLCNNETKKEVSTHRIQDFSKGGLCYVFVMPMCTSVYVWLWSPAGKGLTSWLSFVVSNCEFVTFPLIGILGQEWYLIVSIPDLCTLTYFYMEFRFADFTTFSLNIKI